MRIMVLALIPAFLFLACSTDQPTGADDAPLLKSARPFKGSLAGSNDFRWTSTCRVGLYPGISVHSVQSGELTHLGQTTAVLDICNAAYSSERVAGALNGEFVLTAANGDEIFGSASGTWVEASADPRVIEAEGTYVITGGTGRFEGATGGGDLWSTQTGTFTANTGSTTFDGTISY